MNLPSHKMFVSWVFFLLGYYDALITQHSSFSFFKNIAGRSAPRPAARRAPPPAPVRQAPPPAPASSGGGGSMLGGLGATIAQGMAFGTGSAVAHRAVDSVLGPRTIQHEAVPAAAGSAAPELSKDACGMHLDAFTKCLNSSGSEISKCQFYMDMLNECKNNPGSMINA